MAERITNEIIKAISDKLNIDKDSIDKSTSVASLSRSDIEDIYENLCTKLNIQFDNNSLDQIRELLADHKLTNCERLVLKLSQALEDGDQRLSKLEDNFRTILVYVLNSPSHEPLYELIRNRNPSLIGSRINGGDEVGLKMVIASGREWEGLLGLDGLLEKDYPIAPRDLFIAYTSLSIIAKSHEKGEQYFLKAMEINKKWGPYLDNQILSSTLAAQTNRKSGGCFIATAVYGSYSNERVIALRNLRDNILVTNCFGRIFIKLYYLVSPKLSGFIGNRMLLQRLLKNFVFEPLFKYVLPVSNKKGNHSG